MSPAPIPAGFVRSSITGCIVPEHEVDTHHAAYKSRTARHPVVSVNSLEGATAAAAAELERNQQLRAQLAAQNAELEAQLASNKPSAGEAKPSKKKAS